MTENTENFVIEYLKSIRASLERMENDIHDIKFPVTQIEENMIHVTHKLDRMDERILRIEKRLDLVTA